ncbi:MAG TPA: hypothetical protein VFJ82_19345 [Longimicrobium sp.]|nr:hypothetical protein [Longimicrobium sp.]
MEPLTPAVERRIEKLWAADGDRRRVRDALMEYGRESYQREHERVRLAILKLSAGDVEKALALTETARSDYRDVLAWAEYPEEFHSPLAFRLDPSDADRARLEEVRRRDREQYEAWLRTTIV